MPGPGRGPASDSGRLLFGSLFPPLMWLDCEGALRPGLVESWTPDSAGMWTITLKAPAQLGPDQPVSTAAVAKNLGPSPGAGVPGIDSAVPLNQRQIRLFTSRNQESVLHGLADPELAVPDGVAFASRVLDLPAEPGQPVIQLRLPPLGDPRDALDRGADLMVTRDPSLLEYARRPEFTIHQLPWSRTYVLVQPPWAPPIAAGTTQAERESLADAVDAEARGAEPPFWWLESNCAARAASASGSSDRIVYPQDDAVARGLAERLVALRATGSPVRAGGLSVDLLASLGDGSELAYVVSLPKHSLQPCRELRHLPAGARIRPLIETRAHAIVRRGAPPLAVDRDGTVRVVGR